MNTLNQNKTIENISQNLESCQVKSETNAVFQKDHPPYRGPEGGGLFFQNFFVNFDSMVTKTFLAKVLDVCDVQPVFGRKMGEVKKKSAKK